LLLGLAPGGVFPAAAVAGGAVRSYRTVSPLPPARHTGDGLAVYFLWHFPWGRPRRALPGTVPPWSPDFPLPARWRKAAIRPSGTKGFGFSRGLCQSFLGQSCRFRKWPESIMGKTIGTSPVVRGTGQTTTATSDRSAPSTRILPRSPMIGIRWR